MSTAESKVQDRILQILRLMVMHGENRFCFECHQRGPTYVNMTIGSFVCTNCGGALRKYSHRIKSFCMSNFSPTEIEFLRKRGNKACRKIYLALNNEAVNQFDVKDNLDDYLRMKYQLKKWYREPTSEIEAEATADNQEIMDQAEKAENQKNHAIPGINATKGLIITPPFQSLAKHNSSTSTNARLSQSNKTNGSAANNDGGNKPKTQLTMLKPPPCDVFNGFGDDAFPPATTKTSAFEPVPPFDPFNAFGDQTAASKSGEEQDFFSSLVSDQRFVQQHSSPFAPPTTNNLVGGPNNLYFQTGSPFTATHPTSSMASTATTGSQDKYAALAELDNMFKMKANVVTPAFSHSDAFSTSSSTAVTASAAMNPSQWSTLTTAVPSQPVFSFPVPGTLSSADKPPNPFTSGAVKPMGTVNPFEQNFATTAPQNTTAAMPFPVASVTNGLPIGGPPNTRNPFFSASTTGAPSMFNPFTPYYSANSSLGKPEPAATTSMPNTFPAFQPTAANQYWAPVSGTGLGQAFPASPFGANSTLSGNPWTNGASKAGDTTNF